MSGALEEGRSVLLLNLVTSILAFFGMPVCCIWEDTDTMIGEYNSCLCRGEVQGRNTVGSGLCLNVTCQIIQNELLRHVTRSSQFDF